MTAVITEEDIRFNRQQWADACEGKAKRKYRQHRNALASPEYKSFCCLGVAMESVTALCAKRADSGAYYDGLTVSLLFTNEHGSRIASALSQKQGALLGVSDTMQRFLMGLNDSRHVPLAVIGKVILHLPIADRWKDYGEHHEWENEIPAIRELLADYQKDYDLA